MLIVVGVHLGITATARAQVTTYTDETAYQTALTNLGYDTFQEGFENDPTWGAVRTPNTAAGVTSKGITWTSNHPDAVSQPSHITTGSGPALSGLWGFYSRPHGDPDATGSERICAVTQPPASCFKHDGFIGTTAPGVDTIYGVGGWINGTSGGDIILILNGDETNPVDFGDSGLITAIHKFFGVIDTGGFTQFEYRETEGTIVDDKFIFADDFTFGTGLSPGNTPPVANDNAYATNAETELSIAAPGVLGNDTDADGDPLTAILNVDPSNGILTLNPNGSFTYTPNTNFTGPDTFTYHANDGTADSNIATVMITVNLIPIPDDTFTVIVRDASGIAIAGADVAVDHPGTAPQTTDADGQATFSLPAGGTYMYTVEAAGYVTQEVSSAHTVVDVILAEIGTNTPPVANENAYATNAETELSIAAPGVLGNDTDADGDPLTAILNVDSSNGILTLNANGSFTYTPNTNFTGPDTFTYHANDGMADSNIATVTITVNPRKDPPVTNDALPAINSLLLD